MLVFYQAPPEPSLRGGRGVLGAVPKDEEIIDDVYDALVIEEPFKNGLVRGGFGCGER